jgi:predicted naringenin-chalcone synthase
LDEDVEIKQQQQMLRRIGNLLGISLLLVIRLCVNYKLKRVFSMSKRIEKVDVMETQLHLH